MVGGFPTRQTLRHRPRGEPVPLDWISPEARRSARGQSSKLNRTVRFKTPGLELAISPSLNFFPVQDPVQNYAACAGDAARIGCRAWYVSDRHSHSSGPKRKWRSQIGLAISWNIHTPATT